MHAHELTQEQRVQALSSLMVFTQKRVGRIKGCACANRSKQRGCIDKELATSPTVATDSLMITAVINAIEMRDIITLDIPGSFLYAGLDEEVIMVLGTDGKLYMPQATYSDNLTRCEHSLCQDVKSNVWAFYKACCFSTKN
eukprot:CCRYP_016097-RA/>CCRYP_016097-RA protein AED:0.34 eAED:0.55 QI:0/0/0/1/0/0/2/0/140